MKPVVIDLKNDPKIKRESDMHRISFPFGEVYTERTSDNDIWVHIRTRNEDELVAVDHAIEGKITDARMDINGRNTSEIDIGEFNDPDLYHVAFRLSPKNKIQTNLFD